MQLTFLGTAAANANPEAFCSCANCDEARRLGGPSLRKRSSALIDDELLIDFGPDIMTASSQHGHPLTNVRYCLQTHPHSDHLDVSHFLSRSPAYGVVGAPRLHWYASPATARWAARLFADVDADDFLDPAAAERLNLTVHTVEPFEPFAVGRYRIIAFPASHHLSSMACLLYAIEADGRTIFYGTDTGALSEDVWRGFHRHGLRFDVVVLDHTYGPDRAIEAEHLNAREVAEHVRRMRDEGLLADGARAFATHIAHEDNPAHPALAALAAANGYEVAYDGLTV